MTRIIPAAVLAAIVVLVWMLARAQHDATPDTGWRDLERVDSV